MQCPDCDRGWVFGDAVLTASLSNEGAAIKRTGVMDFNEKIGVKLGSKCKTCGGTGEVDERTADDADEGGHRRAPPPG